MPEFDGFSMLAKIDPQPLVVFTTAYSQHALKAFEVNSIDYLLKPIESEQLERALNKIDRIRGGLESRPDVAHVAEPDHFRNVEAEYVCRAAAISLR